MTPLKIAILDDDKVFLKEIIENIKEIETVQLLFYSCSSEEFIEKSKNEFPDVVLLDIKLSSDECRTGIDVANILKVPTIFFTGARNEYADKIESLKLNPKFPPVEAYNKVPDNDILKIIFRKFKPLVIEWKKSLKITFKPKGQDEIVVNRNEIVLIETIKSKGNHIVYFKSRKSIEIVDKNFEYFKSIGLTEDVFYYTQKSFMLNIGEFKFTDNKLEGYHFDNENPKILKNRLIEIPEEKRKDVKKFFFK